MASPNWLLVILEFSIITYLAGLTITLGDSVCGTDGTYTANSAYQKNLNDTLSDLTGNNYGDGFFNSSSNSTQDNAYALAVCRARGDFDVENCLRCVRAATVRLRLDCPNQKKATGWYDGTCMLRYSNTTFDMNDNDVVPLREGNISDWGSVVDPLRNLLEQLLGKSARDGNNKASNYSDGIPIPQSTGSIQASMQCIPNIPRNICGDCFVNATESLLTCCNGSPEAVVLYRYSCFLRYTISVPVTIPYSPSPTTSPPRNPSTIQPPITPTNPTPGSF